MLSGVACFPLLLAFKPVLPSSLSLISRLWLLVDRVARFAGLWVRERAVCGAGWGVVRLLLALDEVRSAIVRSQGVVDSCYQFLRGKYASPMVKKRTDGLTFTN